MLTHLIRLTRARFLSLARSKPMLCSTNHRAGYFSNLACDWLSIVWAYSEQETENGPWNNTWLYCDWSMLGNKNIELSFMAWQFTYACAVLCCVVLCGVVWFVCVWCVCMYMKYITTISARIIFFLTARASASSVSPTNSNTYLQELGFTMLVCTVKSR